MLAKPRSVPSQAALAAQSAPADPSPALRQATTLRESALRSLSADRAAGAYGAEGPVEALRPSRETAAAARDEQPTAAPGDGAEAAPSRILISRGEASVAAERDPAAGAAPVAFRAPSPALAPAAAATTSPETPANEGPGSDDAPEADASLPAGDAPRSGAAPPSSSRLAPAAEAARAATRRGAPAPPPGQNVSDLRRGVVAGLVLAAGLIALAVFVRPVVVESTPAADPAAATGLASGPIADPARTVAAAPATPAAAATVRLRFGPDQSDARRDALRTAALAAGYGAVEVRTMPFPVARSRIEYFAPADRAAAEALARALAPLSGSLIEVRDLGATATVEAGGIDAWIAQ